MSESEYDYLMSSSEIVGKNLDKWMAVVGKEIVAVGPTAKEVFLAAKAKHPDKEPFIAKFPRQTVLLL